MIMVMARATPAPRTPLPRADLARDAATNRTVDIHGHEVVYRAAGAGPVVVLVHGMAGSGRTWARVMPQLAEHHTVIAPDLLGHGESAKPRGDYSLGAYACGIRDLLAVLGHDRATFVGHSLGGGVAMQLAYQFPHLCERLVLVGSGGLGKEVSGLLRFLSVPGSEYVLGLALDRRLHGFASRIGSALGRLGFRGDPALEWLWSGWTGLTDVRAQRAFVHTIRAVIDPAGQRVSARDRLYLAEAVPTLIAWGDRDQIIPVAHAHAAHDLIPGSRLEIFEGAGHFVPLEQPDRFVEVLEDFLATTVAAPTLASAG
ncbi:MAG: alpha/beta fold hydrolase [Actinomycetota bacterium]|nr:alpha/beta fold hydrolase [Actinomycetota bacterium]